MITSRAHCNACGGERNHTILHLEEKPWVDEDEERGFSGNDRYEMLKCLGCDNIKMRHTSWFSEDEGPTVRYFPPSMSRRKPEWLSLLLFSLPKEEWFVHDLLQETYTALQNDLPHLAAMGVRSLLERIMIAKVGDLGSFAKNVSAFEAKGFVSRVQRERLDTILEAGHATIHRAFTPSTTDLITLIEITESIVETVYLHEAKVKRLQKRVPLRAKK